jgi:hypothetical protein
MSLLASWQGLSLLGVPCQSRSSLLTYIYIPSPAVDVTSHWPHSRTPYTLASGLLMLWPGPDGSSLTSVRMPATLLTFGKGGKTVASLYSESRQDCQVSFLARYEQVVEGTWTAVAAQDCEKRPFTPRPRLKDTIVKQQKTLFFVR